MNRSFFFNLITAAGILTCSYCTARGDEVLDAQMRGWETQVRERIAKDDKLRASANTGRLALLSSRKGKSDLNKTSYSFVHGSNELALHGNDVQIIFEGGHRTPGCFVIRPQLMVDLGKGDFAADPDPKKVPVTHAGLIVAEGIAREGHLYLQRVIDRRGNDFYVLIEMVAVDPKDRYIAFIWRRLPETKAKGK